MQERNYWLGFSNFNGIGPARFSSLLKHFGSARSAWSAKQTQLREVLGEKMAGEFDQFRNEFSIEDYVKKLEEKNVWFITLQDKDYPKLLREIKNPPFLIYGRGNRGLIQELDRGPVMPFPPAHLRQDYGGQASASAALPLEASKRSGVGSPSGRATPSPAIAVVGTRRITQYGREVTNLLTSELVLNGFTIVSGLALGVDAQAHQSAIENKGKTIAVLGCGVDCCSPAENSYLYNSILKGDGCIVSEYPLGAPPTKGSFPQRNRIIAGLSLAVLVTEGAEDSGALITADFALKFNRKVFAVPGPITSSLSKGPYALIQKGAKLVTSSKDIISELGISNFQFLPPKRDPASGGTISNKPKIIGTKEENLILKVLENEPLHFDEIVRKTGLPSSQAGSALSLMEVKGMVKSLEGGMFSV